MDETFERDSISQKLESSAAPVTERKSKESDEGAPNEQLINVEHQSQYSSEPTYRTNIDSETCRKIEEDVKKQFSDEKQTTEQIQTPPVEERKVASIGELSVDNPIILDCLFALKRACQANYLRFDQIENLIYGDEYVFEARITTPELQQKLTQTLKLDQEHANLLAQFLVETGGSTRPGQSAVQKIQNCKVIIMLQQNLSMHCGNIQTYSRNKEIKMKLIIGKHLVE